MTETERPRALDGLRVLDCSTGTAGPLAAMLLADFGADVVKVEGAAGDPGRIDPAWPVWNRGKRSIRIDRDSVADLDRMGSLLRAADVYITHEPSSALRGGPLDPPRALATNPRLVVLHVPAYTTTRSWAGAVDSHGLLHAASGLALNQASFSAGPVDAVAPYLCAIHGMWAATAAAAALYERRTSGLGQVVTVSGMHAAAVAACSWYTFDSNGRRRTRPQVGGPAGNMPYYRIYQCGDGQWVFLGALSADFTRKAFAILGVSHILDDPRLGGRGQLALLDEDIGPWAIEQIAAAFRSRPAAAWLEELGRAKVAASAVAGRDDWLDHPQVAAIGMRVELDDPDRGRVVMPGVPLVLSTTLGVVDRPAPAMHAHDADVDVDWREPGPWAAADPAPVGGSADRSGGPLAGVRVLDLGSVLAGPFAGTLLAELGAEVVKVEPLAGDTYRGAGFAQYNKGQRGLAINLREPAGRDAFLALASASDVVVDNYRGGVLARLRIGHEDLRQVNPRITSTSISGFGTVGPLASIAGYDPVLQAMSGMARAQGGEDDPVLTSVPSCDVAGASMAAFGSIVSLLARERHGGQEVSTSLTGVVTIIQAADLVRFAGRPIPQVGGRDFAGPSPVDRFYPVADGWVRIRTGGSANDVAAALGCDISGDCPVDELTKVFGGHTRAEAVERLTAAGIAAVPVRHVRETAVDPAFADDGIFRRYPVEALGSWVTTGRHAIFSGSPPPPTFAAPRLGEHTVAVLTDAELDRERIDDLLRRGIAAQADPPVGPPVME